MGLKDYYTWTFPNIPEHVAQELDQLGRSLVVVGVIGRSRCVLANKMRAFGMEPPVDHEPTDGQLQCYYKPGSSTLLLHFETTFDDAILGQQIDETMEQDGAPFDFDGFYERMKCRFVRMMLLALHVCHILVYVETGQTFDLSLVTIFQLMKFAREQHLMQFLPSLLKETPAGRLLGEKCRLCTPRILFLFENFTHEEGKTRECVSACEFQTEDSIYELLRHHQIITNSSSSSLLALPNNKQFVFYNAHDQLHADRLLQSIEFLNLDMRKLDVKEEEDDLEVLELAPFDGFVKSFGESFESTNYEEQQYKTEHTAWHFLQRHVQDALLGCFDEGSFKQVPQRGQLQLLNAQEWHDCIAELHKLLVSSAGTQESLNEIRNEDYQVFLQSFDESLNYEKKFWAHLCEIGLKMGIEAYKKAAPAIYGSSMHQQLLAEATLAFEEEGRGPPAEASIAKMTATCLRHWQDGRQQCEQLSLRSQPCTQPKEMPHDKHNSGVIHVSSCNCGRTQGRREDPFSLRQANYEFYEHMVKMCNLCVKVKQFKFPIFEPTNNEYRAAAFEVAFPLLHAGKNRLAQDAELDPDEEDEELPTGEREEQHITQSNGCSQPLSPTFGSDLNMSIAGFGVSLNESEPCFDQSSSSEAESTCSGTSSEESNNELVLQLKEPAKKHEESCDPDSIAPLPSMCLTSTTEYLPGLVHTLSKVGLLPLFPSWSLACVGPSSIYSHNTGLQEHFQSGFLSGANFLLPWDVQLRLVHASKHYHNSHQPHMSKKQQRYRKHGDRMVLKIFVGFEYECSRGHRFMMCRPDRVLRGGADIERDTCSKMVHTNMPLYYPCPCRSQNNYLAQLMRIHVVTPKAPVNIIVDPKVCMGKDKYTFTLGSMVPPRLSQSAYWILRLPYVYQGDDALIAPPEKLEPDDIMAGGYLLAGMFGIAETDPTLDLNDQGHLDTNELGTFTRI
ncbi:GL17013 [Drosophila persimilis]|uniref:Nonsense-mediated mRNA decay factor SMG8 n=1 Tax=Drosophila persimilis TaxID=7234 RepID=SMG8_DROPE|nr:protein SMG8 [Drosophila persimilis]B4GH42.1 RecName: Full=Nonsense-mediated mRNA decay factor SMG8; AltName: Full=Protein smg-8 homolog [Drosophila persimilis]EDW35812.1 GL17013 [Drosophila persimilis]